MVTQTPPPPTVDTATWQPARWAEQLLHVSPHVLHELVLSGKLNALAFNGRLYLDPATVITYAEAQAASQVNLFAEIYDNTAAALRAYLEANPGTGSWDLAVTHGLPLVSSRRGRSDSWREYGLRFHTVAIPFPKLYAWVVDNEPSIAAVLPSMARSYEAFLQLDGVESVRWITPLNNPGEPHRVSRWLRVDPQRWPVHTDEVVAERVAGPSGADYVDGVAGLPR